MKNYILADILRQLEKLDDFEEFASPHEAYAVMQQGLEDIWSQIKLSKGYTQETYRLVCKLAALSIRYGLDITFFTQKLGGEDAQELPS